MKMAILAGLVGAGLACAPAVAGDQIMAGNQPSRSAATEQSGVTLQLLGTAGGPGAMVGRAGIASLLTVNGHHYLIDAGDGVTGQLAQAGIPETAIHKVFITHLHDDHTAGLPALASFAYTLHPGPLEILGPPQTWRLVQGLLAFMGPNAEIRMAERHLPDPASLISARELPVGQAYSDAWIKVFAFENTHFHFPANSEAPRDKSYAYRIEAGGRTFVFTGDTGPSAALAEFVRGADVLVCEMVTQRDIASVPPYVVRHMLEEHLTAVEIGKLASAAGVKQVIISHVRDASDADLAGIRQFYSGPVTLGRDLAKF